MLDSLRASIAAGEPPIFVTVIAAALLAALLFLALRRRAPGWLLLLLGTLPFAAVWVSPCNRIYSGHGFLHMSTLYQMLNGYYPPMNPILWGVPQLYPWAHLVPVAALADALRIPPTIGHPAINVLCACATLVLFYRTAALVVAERAARVLAVLLSVYSLTVFNQGPFVALLRVFTSYEAYDGRVLPPSNFTNWSGMPIGFVFHALFFWALLRIFVGPPPRWTGYVLLAVAIPGAAYGYPLMWPAMLAELCTAAALVLALRGLSAVRPVVSSLAAIAAGSLPFLPYMRQLGTGRSGASLLLFPHGRAATVMITPDLGYLELKLARVALYLLPLALVLLWKRSTLRALWHERPLALAILGGAVLVNVAMYVLLLVTPPLANEYKFMIYASFALGILAAPALHAVYVERRVACYLIVAAFLLPVTGNWLACGAWTACDREVEERVDLRRRDAEQQAVYDWIRTRTERDAAFVDTTLEVSMFGQRQLLVGTGDWYQPGWTTAPRDLYSASSYPPEVVRARERLVEELYLPTEEPVSRATLAELARMTGRSDVFVVARGEPARRRMAATPELEEVFANGAAAVYRLRKEGS